MPSANKTTVLELNQWAGNEYPKRDDFNADNLKIENAFAAHKTDNLYQTAGGTGSTITLTIGETLVSGLPVNFIASANNGGATTTINGKPLYKPNTTTAPNLTAGKPYTVVYNLSSDCFFIKASAEGTATADKVLAGFTFSNDNDTGIVGTSTSKKWATGTASTLTTGTATYTDGSTRASVPMLTVTGLTFKPSYIFCINTTNHDFAIFTTINDGFYTPTAKIITGYLATYTPATIFNYKGDVSPINVSANGFTIPVTKTGSDYTWWAFE